MLSASIVMRTSGNAVVHDSEALLLSVLLAKRHCAQTHNGDLQVAAAKVLVLHRDGCVLQ